MQTAFLKLLLLSSALSLVAPLAQAKPLANDICGGRQCQVQLQKVVKQPAYSPAVMAMHLSSPRVGLDNQIVAGLSLGSVLSAGSAQQSVDQEGLRDEAAKGDATKQNSRSQQPPNKGALRRGTAGGKPSIESAGASGNGSTASGSADGPLRRPPAQENW